MRMNREETVRFYDRVDALKELAGNDKKTLSIIRDVERLYSIESQLSQISVRECCEQMTERQEKWNDSRRENLRNEASLIAEDYGCVFYHQTDPRGCQVYLMPSSKIPEGAGYEWIDSHYNSHAIAFYK